MQRRFLTIASGLWIASAIICGFGYVELFGPLSVALLGLVLVFDKSAPEDRLGPFMAAAVTAGLIWLGLQQQDRRQEQVAYWAHRETINCRAADQWEALGNRPAYPDPKPSESDLRRCSALDDASDFESALKARGW